MKVGSLFAGIGGFELAAERADIRRLAEESLAEESPPARMTPSGPGR